MTSTSQPCAERVPSINSARIVSTYGTLEPHEIEILLAVADKHPRAFWNAAQRPMFDHREGASKLFGVAADDERLLRLCLARWRPRPIHYASHGEGHQLGILLDGIHRMGRAGKRKAWVDARVDSVARICKTLSPSAIFSLMGASARNGDERGARLFLDVMASPDARGQRRVDDSNLFGSSSFCGEFDDRAKDRAALAEGAEPPSRGPTNFFFWTAARASALDQADPAAAARWDSLSADAIATGLLPSQSESIAQILSRPASLAALRVAQPQFAPPTFYCFDRAASLGEAILFSPPGSLRDLFAYEATAAAQSTYAQGSNVPILPWPAAAIALLLGIAPDPAWLDPEDERVFKVPKRAIDAAKDGSLLPKNLRRLGGDGSGKAHTLASLATAIRPPAAHPAPKPRRKGP